MFALIRTIIYLSLIISALLLFVPATDGSWAGLLRPESAGMKQGVGLLVGTAGIGLALWCSLLFAVIGRGTPLPFDPPRRLVTIGPYRFVRNPMALGVGGALIGVAVYYESWAFLGYTCLFFVIIHLLVTVYEEPTLRETFGDDYLAYCDRVGRWWPKRQTTPAGGS